MTTYWFEESLEDETQSLIFAALDKILTNQPINRSEWASAHLSVYQSCASINSRHLELHTKVLNRIQDHVRSIKGTIEVAEDKEIIVVYSQQYKKFSQAIIKINYLFKSLNDAYRVWTSMGNLVEDIRKFGIELAELSSDYPVEHAFSFEQLCNGFWQYNVVNELSTRLRRCILAQLDERRFYYKDLESLVNYCTQWTLDVRVMSESFVRCCHSFLTNEPLTSFDDLDDRFFESYDRVFGQKFEVATGDHISTLAKEFSAQLESCGLSAFDYLSKYEQYMTKVMRIEYAIADAHCLGKRVTHQCDLMAKALVYFHRDQIKGAFTQVLNDTVDAFSPTSVPSAIDSKVLLDFLGSVKSVNVILNHSKISSDEFMCNFSVSVKEIFARYAKYLRMQNDDEPQKNRLSSILMNVALFHQQLHDRFLTIVGNNCFDFESLFERAFTSMINRLSDFIEDLLPIKDSTANLLALVFDIQVRRIVSADHVSKYEQISDDIDRSCELFKYLEEKDEFVDTYKRYLSVRLIQNLSTGNDIERRIIDFLREQCGRDYVSHLSTMIVDVDKSRELMTKFTPTDRSFDFETKVLRTTFWPFEGSEENLCLHDGNNLIAQFERFYKDKHTSRKLVWSHKCSTVDLKANFPSGSYIFLVNHYQFAILTVLDAHGKVKLAKLKELSGVEKEKEFSQNMRVLQKFKVVIMKDDCVQMNNEFQSSHIRLKLHSCVPYFETRRGKATTDNTDHPLEDSRKNFCMAAITRMLKQKKKLSKKDLYDMVCRDGQLSFLPTDRLFDQSLDYLASNQMIKVHESGDLEYLA
ncbi:hypothetical protein ACOME3_005166 [Neoechinorhynchus agilis]